MTAQSNALYPSMAAGDLRMMSAVIDSLAAC